MTHLGTRVTALVDGQLPAEEAEEALAHTVCCPPCAELLHRERDSRRALAQCQDVAPDDALTSRLLAIAGPAHHPPRRRRSRPVVLGVGAAASIGAVAVGIGVLGSVGETRSDPNDILAAVQGTVGSAPEDLPSGVVAGSATDEVADWLADEGWSVPESLPADIRVVDVALFETEVGEVLELELAGATSSVRVLQQQGRLADLSDAAATADGNGRWRLGTGGQHVVLQSGSCVVVITPATGNGAGSRLLEAMPAAEYDTSVVGRLARGWDTLSSWAL